MCHRLSVADDQVMPLMSCACRLDQFRRDYRFADMAWFDRAIVEPRALPVQLGDTEQAQTTNYLNASDMKAWLLLNFGARTLERHRFIPSQSTTSVTSARPVDSIIVE